MPITNVPSAGETVTARDIRGSERSAPEKDRIAAKKVAREFEALFTGMMLKTMRETVGKDGLTGGGRGEEVYRSLLDQEYAKAISEGQGLGLSKRIESELLRSLPVQGGKTKNDGA